MGLLLVVTVAFYSGKTVLRSHEWTDIKLLSESALKVNPSNAKVYMTIGNYYAQQVRGSFGKSVLIRGVASFQGWICTIQWTPSNPATLGTSQSVLIRGVASFQGWICTIQCTPSNPATLGTSQSVLIRGV